MKKMLPEERINLMKGVGSGSKLAGLKLLIKSTLSRTFPRLHSLRH